MRIGVLIPSRGLFLKDDSPPDPGFITAFAELAEAYGLDSVWLGDSLTSKPRLEPLSALAAVAARTSRVRLGTGVLLPLLRHPLALAHAIGTVDYLSRGRLVLGMGVGGAFTPDMRDEWEAVGVPIKERAGRLEETIAILRQLWTGEVRPYEGRYHRFAPSTVRPLPWRGSVPILLATHHHTGSERQQRRAARLGDGIISITASPEQYRELKERVWRYAREEGRDPSQLEAAYYMTVNIGPDPQRAREEAHDFLIKYYKVDHWGDQWGPFDRPEVVARRMREFAEAGVETLAVRFASYRPLEQLSLFVNEVLPLVE